MRSSFIKDLFLFGSLGVLALVVNSMDNKTLRSPANDNNLNSSSAMNQKVYNNGDAIDYGLKALQEQPVTKDIVDTAKRKGDAIVKDLEHSVKDTVMEIPASVLVLGAKLAMDQKIAVSTHTPWDQKVQVIIKPDKAELSWGGDSFMFIDGLRYNLSTDSRSSTNLNVNMDF